MKHRGLLALTALLLLAAWEIGVLAAARATTATDDDWHAAAERVRREHRPDDLILFAPRWASPVGRKWLGDMMTLESAARLDAARYPRIWELSIRDASSPEVSGAPAVDEWFGRVRVRRFDRPAAHVVWDLGPRSTLVEVAHDPRRCVVIGLRRREPGRLVVPDAILGSQLVVRAGLADFRSRKANTATVRVRVKQGDTVLAETVIDDDDGWVALPVATTTPGAAALSFEAVPEGDLTAIVADVCIAAEARQ